MSTNLSGNTLTLGSTSLDENTLKSIFSNNELSSSSVSSSTNLSGNTLTLGSTSLDENTLKVLVSRYR